MSARGLRATLALTTIVLLSLLALPRAELQFEPTTALPDLAVNLNLSAEDFSDPSEVARRWVVPIESAIRSVGGAERITGSVGSDGATLTVSFRAGTDLVRKSAAFSNDLAALRRQLSEGSSLTVTQLSSDSIEANAVLSITGAAAKDSAIGFAEKVRQIPGVRRVTIYGLQPLETEYRLRDAVTTNADVVSIRSALRRRQEVRSVGQSRSGDSLRSVVIDYPDDYDVISAGSGVTTIGAVAAVESRRAESERIAHVNGQRAVLMIVYRDRVHSPYRLDRDLRDLITSSSSSSVKFEIFRTEATPLRRMVRRFAIAFCAATIALFVAVALTSGIVQASFAAAAFISGPLAAIAVLGLFGIQINHATLPAILVAAAGIGPFTFSRAATRLTPRRWLVGCALTAWVIPLGISLSATSIRAILASPSIAFAIGMTCSALTAATVPDPRSVIAPRWSWLRTPLRRSPALALTAGAISYASLTMFGAGLDPREGSLTAEATELRIAIRLPAGSTLDQTERSVSFIEKKLATENAFARTWSFINSSNATVLAELLPRHRDPREVRRLERRLRLGVEIPTGTLSVGRIAPRAFRQNSEERPLADESGYVYRILLRGSEPERIQLALDRLRQRLEASAIRSGDVRPEWGTPSLRVALIPRPGVATPDLASLAAILRDHSSPPAPLIDTRNGIEQRTIVTTSWTPRKEDDIPQRRDLLYSPLRMPGRAIVAGALLNPVDEIVLPRMDRQDGRFIVPVDISITAADSKAAIKRRSEIDRSVATVSTPEGTDIARPDLSAFAFSREKWRMVALAATIPLLLVALSIVASNSIAAGLVASAPLLAGVAIAAPFLRFGRSGATEMTLGLVAMAMAAALPLLIRLTMDRQSARRVYRLARRMLLPFAAGAGMTALLLILPALRTDSTEDAWSGPLSASGLVLFGAFSTGALINPALMLSIVEWRRRRSEETAALRRPVVWKDVRRPVMEVRHVTKVYGNGHIALRDVSFTLEPGIIGLLGPNGAGKTTLLRILSGLLSQTRGEVLHNGIRVTADNLDAYRFNIGFLPQEFNAYPGFTAEEFLDYWAMERGMDDRVERATMIEDLLDAVGLAEHARRKVRDFSGGMRQRIGIARALIGSPPILIVDEPTTGLDIEGRSRFRSMMLAIAVHRIVVLSTHIASDIEATSNRILAINRGTLLFDGSPETLIDRARGYVFEALFGDTEIREMSHHYRLTARIRTVHGVRVRGVAKQTGGLPGHVVEPNLEEAYLAAIDRAEDGQLLDKRGRFSFLSD